MADLEQWPTARLLSTAARLVEREWNERLHDLGLTHAGVTVLAVLSSQGPMTQAKLAGIIRVQAQTMGKTITRLEGRGHIERARNATDRRSNVVRITEEGLRALAAAGKLDSSYVTGDEVAIEELRALLKTVVRSLGNTKDMQETRI